MFSQIDWGIKTDFTQVTHVFNVATVETKLTDVIDACNTCTEHYTSCQVACFPEALWLKEHV